VAFALQRARRDDLIVRVRDSVAAVAFHQDVNIGDPQSRAEEIEARAYAKAEAAFATTAGGRPQLDGVRLYVRFAAEFLKSALSEGASTSTSAAESATTTGGGAGAAAGCFDVASSGGSDREFLTAERARAVLSPLLAPGASFRKVTLTGKSFGRDAAEVVAEAVRNLGQQLEELVMSDIVAGRPETEGIEVMTTICSAFSAPSLTKLDLSDNALGEKGIRACGNALTTQTALEELLLQNIGGSSGACAAVFELLPSPHKLKKLHLHNNMSGDAGAVAIAKLLARAPALEDFRMSSSRVGEEGGKALVESLATRANLIKLNVTDNGLGAATGVALSRVLNNLPKLEELTLDECGLETEGVVEVLRPLYAGACPALRKLGLSCNDVGQSGLNPIAATLAKLPNLASLTLAENELGDTGAVFVAKALAMSPAPVETLDLSNNEIGAQGALAAAMCANAKKASFKAKGLNLNGNTIPAIALAKVQEMLEGIGRGDILAPTEDNDGDEEMGADALAAAFAKLTT